MKSSSSLHRLTVAGMIAALYTALTLILPFASFGPVQIRFSEMLTVLPVLTADAVPGLALGCAIANAVGMAMGANIAGGWDILVGTSATLLAALCSYALRNVRFKGLPILSTLPPVLFNALLVGGELCLVIFGNVEPVPLLLTMAQVGLGQLLPCIGGGLLLFKCIENSGFAQKFTRKP
ncbi:MAG: QueT transporter family protein [Ruminococcaceae bacterium]|nr:QueT transporter family protein [Oscillospiraceae bacterium]